MPLYRTHQALAGESSSHWRHGADSVLLPLGLQSLLLQTAIMYAQG